MKLSVIIVNYNVKHYLAQCLNSVQTAIAGLNAEVIVVDNHSHDGSLDYLRGSYPWVRFVASNHNLGFARANNIAIRQAKGEYILLLNPDTVVGEKHHKDGHQLYGQNPRQWRMWRRDAARHRTGCTGEPSRTTITHGGILQDDGALCRIPP